MSESTPIVVHCRSRWHDRIERCVSVEPGETLFSALRRADQPIASSCGGDLVCGRCVVNVLEGQDGLDNPGSAEQRTLIRQDAGPSERLACALEPRAPGLVIGTGYW